MDIRSQKNDGNTSWVFYNKNQPVKSDCIVIYILDHGTVMAEAYPVIDLYKLIERNPELNIQDVPEIVRQELIQLSFRQIYPRILSKIL